jgi:hypothetical protein
MTSLALKDYYFRRGIKYDKATRRFFEKHDNVPTLKLVPAALNILLPKAVPTIKPPPKNPND